MMIQSGFEARGVELSKHQVAYAQQCGLLVQQRDLGALKGVEGQVSAITMVAVFERLVNHAAFLSAVRVPSEARLRQCWSRAAPSDQCSYG